MTTNFLQSKPADKSLVWVFILLVLCQVGFAGRNNAMREHCKQTATLITATSHCDQAKPLDGRFGYTRSDIKQLFDWLGAGGRSFYARSELSLDVLYPLLYALFLSGWLSRLWKPKRWLSWVPWLAAGADVTENSLIAYLALTYEQTISSELGQATLVASGLKWVLVMVSIGLVPTALVYNWGPTKELRKLLQKELCLPLWKLWRKDGNGSEKPTFKSLFTGVGKRLWVGLWRIRVNLVYGSGTGSDPVTFATVLQEEIGVVDDMRSPGHPPKEDPATADEKISSELDSERDSQQVFQQALDANLVGLAFSGGGIRSATFNLGLLQTLASHKLLGLFDYLSTVSGGGYIGSWLSALIHRERLALSQQAITNAGSQQAITDVGSQQAITDVEGRLCNRDEDPAIQFLRQHSNYLTPETGLFTADTWSVVAVYSRNLVLNLLLLVSGLWVLLLIPRLVAAVTDQISAWQGPASVFWLALGVSLGLAAVAAVQIGASFAPLMTLDKKAKKKVPDLEQPAILWRVVAPLVITAFLVSRWLPDAGGELWDWSKWVAVAYLSACALAFSGALDPRRGDRQDSVKWAWLIFSAALAGFVAGPPLQWIGGLLDSLDPRPAWVWGTPLVLSWIIALGVLHIGIMGLLLRDFEREWLSRLGAWLLIIGAVWTAGLAAVIYGPVVVWSLPGWIGGAVASGWAATTIGGLVAARSRPANGGRGALQSLVLTLAPYVFVAGLLAVLGVGLDLWLSRICDDGDSWKQFQQRRQAIVGQLESHRANAIDERPSLYAETLLVNMADAGEPPSVEQPKLWAPLSAAHAELYEQTSTDPFILFGLIVVLIIIGLLLGWRIDVNEFSMHGFYRNRLVRAYLGATVEGATRHRDKQPFTGLNKDDDFELAELMTATGGQRPIHLFNTTLNLVSGKELAWQQRKAAPFILSPLYCGFEPRKEFGEANDGDSIRQRGYRKTANAYGSRPMPLTVGSAVAISGAAASPNMGFRSTPALAFLLTVFNVRLGWWLGNPRHPLAWTRSGPVIALIQLFQELFGKTSDSTKYVYLSDGEHFENLGIYELVRRRCRLIITTDVGADEQSSFDNLGNAIRKCRADMGIEIEIDVDQLRVSNETGFSKWHCAVGDIHYGDGEVGTLLYIKSSLTGDEPEDVLSYARAKPPFPHQTTADQFFDESQFESYRRLGQHVAEEVLKDAIDVATVASANHRIPSLEKLTTALRQRWHRPSHLIEESFTRHTAALDQLFERQRTTPELAFLDAQFYPEWRRLLAGHGLPASVRRGDPLWLPKADDQRRQGFYFCNSLIQLIENVYIDLDLDLEYDHPDNRGWINLFKHWAWSGMFRATWAISAATYGRRFQSFCEHRLGLELHTVQPNWLVREAREISVRRFRNGLRMKRAGFLNVLEQEQIEIFLSYSKVKVHKIAQFELRVPKSGGSKKDLLRFGFGYALFNEHDQIVLFRIQDHLRSTGLGRLALKVAFKTGGLGDPSDDTQLGETYKQAVSCVTTGPGAEGDQADLAACARFGKEFRGAERGFLALLRSVRRESQQNGSA